MRRNFPVTPRILLCRPQGGLTDMISQIGKCCRYGDRYGRLVVVDTDFAGAINFRAPFSDYFVSHDRNLVLSSQGLGLDDITSTLRADDEPSGFDFEKDSAEPVLVHHSMGGGLRKVRIALGRLSVSHVVRQEVAKRMAVIGGPYAAVHIRHTDYATDYQQRLEALQKSVGLPLFVATDNRAVLADAISIFGPGNVFSFSTLPEQAGQPAHTDTRLDAKTGNLDALCDLIMLAVASDYHMMPILQTAGQAWNYSGFSRFADMLHRDIALRRHFVGAEPPGITFRTRLRLRKWAYRAAGIARL